MALRRRDAAPLPLQPYLVPPTGNFEGNDGSWSTFMINAGNQNFRVLVSTSGTVTFLPDPRGCTVGTNIPDDCAALRGIELFGGTKSSGYQAPSSATSIGIYGVRLESSDFASIYGSGYQNFNAEYWSDIVGLGTASSPVSMQLQSQVVAAVNTSIFMGTFGLSIVPNQFGKGQLPTFLEEAAMVNSSVVPGIPSRSYGYTAGASYQPGNYSGSLILGGYDAARSAPPKHSYPISPNLTIGIQSILVNTNTNAYSATLDMQDFGHTFMASIDSTLPYLWLPRPVCDQLQNIFGLTYDNQTDLYLVNETTRQKNLDSEATVVIAFAETTNSPNTTSITLPYLAFDLQASWPIYPNATRYFPIRRAPDNVFILGRTFLQAAYLTVDYERGNFSVAQATFGNQTPIPVIVPILMPIHITQSGGKSGLPTGAIAGIAAGSGVVLLLLIILGLFMWRRRKGRKAEDAKNKAELADARAAAEEKDAFPDLTPLSGTPGRDRGFSNASTTLSSEMDGTGRRYSELASPEDQPREYFGHSKKGSKDTAISELEVLPEIHELPGDGDLMPRGLGVVREESTNEDSIARRSIAREESDVSVVRSGIVREESDTSVVRSIISPIGGEGDEIVRH